MTKRWTEFPGDEARTDASRARVELYGDLSGFPTSILRKVMIESGGWARRFVRSNVWQNVEDTSDGAPALSAVSRSLAGSVKALSAIQACGRRT